MKKETFKRLRLSRETIRGLEPNELGVLLRARGGITNNTQVAQGYCCSTVTGPAQTPSGNCRSANGDCDTMATCAG